jgi:hypothetical protein
VCRLIHRAARATVASSGGKEECQGSKAENEQKRRFFHSREKKFLVVQVLWLLGKSALLFGLLKDVKPSIPSFYNKIRSKESGCKVAHNPCQMPAVREKPNKIRHFYA